MFQGLNKRLMNCRFQYFFSTMAPDIQEQLMQTIMKTFMYTRKQANSLFQELMMCVKKRDLVRIELPSLS